MNPFTSLTHVPKQQPSSSIPETTASSQPGSSTMPRPTETPVSGTERSYSATNQSDKLPKGNISEIAKHSNIIEKTEKEKEIDAYDSMLRNEFGMNLEKMINQCQKDPAFIESFLLPNCPKIFGNIPKKKVGILPSDLLFTLLEHSNFMTVMPTRVHPVVNDLSSKNEYTIYELIREWLQNTLEINSDDEREECVNRLGSCLRIGLLNESDFEKLNKTPNEGCASHAFFQELLKCAIYYKDFDQTPPSRRPHPLSLVNSKMIGFFENFRENNECKITLKIDLNNKNKTNSSISCSDSDSQIESFSDEDEIVTSTQKIFSTQNHHTEYYFLENNSIKILSKLYQFDKNEKKTVKVRLISPFSSEIVKEFQSLPREIAFTLELDKMKNLESKIVNHCLILEIELS